MQPRITYSVLDDGDLPLLEDMCNALMKFQAKQGSVRTDVLASMNFSNRLSPEYAAAKVKQIDLARCDGAEIGFSFATVVTLDEQSLARRPGWAESLSGTAFFPDGYAAPQTVGTVKLLYVAPEFRGCDVGNTLTFRSLEWIKGHSEVGDIWVYVANGNEVVGQFYERFGFSYSHSVFNGFISAYVLTGEERGHSA